MLYLLLLSIILQVLQKVKNILDWLFSNSLLISISD